ncbi:expressed unknown protein [Seminavis robusta]|uniref:Uncharacterized protein n=1 Tax=Seminavis robusta TaxID=568900 RepID=A0A9N8EEL1_9STRA|nr:expressed unknown protein [Seminavis robusta]|eukprot:Sro1069_g237630.1 n/a (402) ;mRNA; f:28025-29230
MSQAKRPSDDSTEELEEQEAEFKRRRLEALGALALNKKNHIKTAREIIANYNAKDLRWTLVMFCEIKPKLLTELRLSVPIEFLRQNGKEVFAQGLQSCPNLKELGLEVPGDSPRLTNNTDAQAFCTLCSSILLSITGLDCFSVQVLGSTDGQSLSQLLRAIFVKVKSCHLSVGCSHPRQNDSDSWVPFEVPDNNILQSLQLSPFLGEKTNKGILGIIRGLTSLTHLDVHLFQRDATIDAKDEIAALLYQNRLESLKMRQCDGVSCLDVLTDALKQNTSLKILSHKPDFVCIPQRPVWASVQKNSREKLKNFAEMMEHNVSLQDMSLGFMCADFTLQNQITYWAHLNKCGRGKLSDPKAPLDELFGGLDTAMKLCPDDPVKLWYGLLRASPGHWAAAAMTGF